MTTEARDGITTYLTMLRQVRSQMKPPKGFHYLGMEDFLLQHGKWYEVRPWTGEYRNGAPKQCFANAALLGHAARLRYVEGIAAAAVINFPTHHGWNVDADGYVVDSTWLNGGTAYFGVEFSISRAGNALWQGDSCVLDDWKRGFKLYREPWQGEDYSRKWPITREMRAAFRIYRALHEGQNDGDRSQ